MVYGQPEHENKDARGIGCVLMASGASRRFGGGKNKLLEVLGTKPLILHTAESCRAAGLSPVIVTRSEEIRRLAEENGYDCVLHDDPEKSATIRHGLGSLLQRSGSGSSASLSGCLFVPGDQPLIRPESIRRMMRVFYTAANKNKAPYGKAENEAKAFESTGKQSLEESPAACPDDQTGSAPIVRLSWKGVGKSPVLFPKSLFPALMSLKGDQGGSTILKQTALQTEFEAEPKHAEQVVLVEAETECELWDADTPEALERIYEAYIRQICKIFPRSM